MLSDSTIPSLSLSHTHTHTYTYTHTRRCDRLCVCCADGYYWKYAQDHNLTNAVSVGMMKGAAPVCQALISACSQNSTLGWLACINAYTLCNMAELSPIQFTGVNVSSSSS